MVGLLAELAALLLGAHYVVGRHFEDGGDRAVDRASEYRGGLGGLRQGVEVGELILIESGVAEES